MTDDDDDLNWFDGDKPEPPPTNIFQLVYFDEIQPSLDVTDFVEGLLTEKSASVVYGESNSGKTFFVTDLALHIAAGKRWRDREVEQGGVIYVTMEGLQGFQNRIAVWRLQNPQHTNVAFASIMSTVNLLDPDQDVQKLIATIKEAAKAFEIPVKFVVIDTLARAMAGGNENAFEDMSRLAQNSAAIQEATGAHVCFIHHSGKDQARGARGHSSLRASIDTEIEVQEVEGNRSATVVKQRDLVKGDVFGFSLRVIEIGKSRRNKPVTSCVVEEAEETDVPFVPKLAGHSKRALEILTDLCIKSGQTGHRDVPAHFNSVPSDWWRQAFYERAMPGDKQGTKKTAFGRASDALVNGHHVGMAGDRVWVVYERERDGN